MGIWTEEEVEGEVREVEVEEGVGVWRKRKRLGRRKVGFRGVEVKEEEE